METTLAVALAGQVSAGLTRGDNELGRAQAALRAIGLMVLNASGREPLVQEALDMIDRTHVTVRDNITTFTYVPDDPRETP